MFQKFLLPVFCVMILSVSACSSGNNADANMTSSAAEAEVISNPEFGIYQDAETPPFEFELVDEVTVQTDFIPSYPAAFTKDEEGRFYYIDSQQSKMAGFEKDGSVIFVTGKEGEGPGDFSRPNSMMVKNDTIMVSNLSGTRIDYFSTAGDFLESRQLPSYISFGSIAGMSPDGYLMIRRSLMSEVGFTMMALDMNQSDPDTVYTFDVLQAEGIDAPDGTSAGTGAGIIDGKLYTGNFYPYKLREMDLQGNTLRMITRDFDKLVPPGAYESGGSRGIRTFGSVGFRAILEDGTIIASAMYPRQKIDPDRYVRRSREGTAESLSFMRTLDFFDGDGTLLYSVTKPVSERYPGFGINYGDDLFYDFYTQQERPVLKTYRLIRNIPEGY